MRPSLAHFIAVPAWLATISLASAQVPHLERGFDPNLQFVSPTAMNEDGTVVAGLSIPALNTASDEPFRWTAAEGIEFLAPPVPWTGLSVDDLSRSGDVLVGALAGPGNALTAYRWTTSSGFSPIAEITARGYSFLNVFAVSDDGTVIQGEAATPGEPIRPILWSASSGLRTIGAQSIDPLRPKVMNDDGSVVAGVTGPSANASGTSLFRWTAATGLEVFPIPVGAASLFVGDIDAAGETIVGTLHYPMDVTRAYRWSQPGGFELLPAQGFGRAEAILINRAGDTIVGRLRPLPTAGGPPTSPGFRLRTGQPLELIPPLPGSDTVAPLAIDDTGAIVLCQGSDVLAGSAFPPTAFIWTSGRDPVPLHGRSRLHLTYGRGLSADGGHVYGEAVPNPSSFSSYEASWDIRLPGTRQVGTRYGTGVPSSNGVGARILAQGSALASANDLALTLVDAPPDRFVLFLCGTTRGFQPNLAGGAGTLLIGGAIGRFVGPGQIQPTGALGTLSMEIDLHALPQPNGPVAAAPGDTYRFQAWFRDVAQGQTSNLSDAVEVTFE